VVSLRQENQQPIYEFGFGRDETSSIFGNLQANILKAHGRDEAYHLFLRFTGDVDKVKAWIQSYAQDSHQVTSAAKQFEDAAKRKANPDYSGGLLGCFFLTAAGYEALGFPTDQFEDSFRQGMKYRQNYSVNLGGRSITIENKDPETQDWQPAYQGEIHAMLLLAQDRDELGPGLKDRVEQVITSLDGIAELFVEHGQRLVTDDGKDLEHFGYRDGISNPLFFKDEVVSKQTDRYDPSASLELVLAKDPLADDANCYGSYLVFRKLKQDIEAFNRQVAELADDVNEGDKDLTAAQVVGRFKDGTPVTDHNSPQGATGDINNFNYEDEDDHKCPVHAHIRKANPRDGRERNRRIVRRGIPYGERGEAEVGLLFICYQNNIRDQFEFIQRVWVDNPNFPTDVAGEDPLVGHGNTQQQWPKTYNDPKTGKQAFSFGGQVTLQGGEYFFAPSLGFLKNIKTQKSQSQNKQEERQMKVLVIARYRFNHFNVDDEGLNQKLEYIEQMKNNLEEQEISEALLRLEGLKEIGRGARPLAVRWFGRKKRYDESEDIKPTAGIEFHYIASFRIDESIEPKERQYGWIAIVSDASYEMMQAELEKDTAEAMLFRLLFDIEAIPLGEYSTPQDVYAAMTPEHWSS
jgi:Dyp-type peroxidase family